MAIAKNGDGDDMSAKKQDYINVVFTFNHILGFPIVYKSINNNNKNNNNKDNSDSKQQEEKNNDSSESSPKLNYRTNRIQFKDVKSEVYQLLWNKQEIDQFCNDVFKIANDKNNKHDGLYFFVLWYGDNNICKTIEALIDSYGNKHYFIDETQKEPTFYKKFGGCLPDCPKTWIVESYKSIKGTSDDAKKINIANRPERPLFSAFGAYGSSTVVWMSYLYPHVIASANKNGGMATQCAKKVFGQSDVAKGKVTSGVLIDQWMYLVGKYFTMQPWSCGGVSEYTLKPKQ